MKLVSSLIFLITFIISAITVNASNENNWDTYFENEKVKIEYKYTNCEYAEIFNQEFVFIKISQMNRRKINFRKDFFSC